jgi:hypothetical protein
MCEGLIALYRHREGGTAESRFFAAVLEIERQDGYQKEIGTSCKALLKD